MREPNLLETPDPQNALFGEKNIEAQTLLDSYPARLTHPNKQIIFEKTCPKGAKHTGAIHVSRWRSLSLPLLVPPGREPTLEARGGVFTYEAPPADTLAWHLNFANADLFCSYGGGFFAQDELQVAEHPALASLREWLSSLGDPVLSPTTREVGTATPVLIRGIERRCSIDTKPSVERPGGIYGARFARAAPEAVASAVTPIEPPTISNILAMEAPVGGRGFYRASECARILKTAYSGFVAACRETKAAKRERTLIHTGHWGTGAYGGNKIVMCALQLLAARLSNVDALIYHTVDEEGQDAYQEGLRIYRVLLGISSGGLWSRLKGAFSRPESGEGRSLSQMMQALEAMRFRWGDPDGN